MTSDPAPIAPATRPNVSLVKASSAEPYRRLAEIFHDVLSEQSLDALLDRIADTLAELVPYEDVHIYEADVVKRRLAPVLARSKWADEVMSESFGFGEGITGWAVEHREAVLANQAHLDPRVRFVPGTPVDPEALIAVPLVARGQLKGALNIYRVGESTGFTEEEFLLAKRFGDAAALALDNAHIRARLEHQAETDSLTGLLNHRAFHERLRQALLEASMSHETVALAMLDLDDFKKVNDVFGHGIGDQLLSKVADVLRGSIRGTDFACRVGGEEFALILPSADLESATSLVGRIAERLESLEVEAAGRLTTSTGIAVGPEHAANPRELVACAEAAMMTAKARGKGEIVGFDESELERPDDGSVRLDDGRTIAHLTMLQSLAGKLVRLDDARRVALTIADELRLLIDYHNCRVFLREGDDLVPIAFRGSLTAVEPGASVELATTRLGHGITGHVAETGEPLLTGDAAKCDLAEPIPGTAHIEESLLAVPLRFGSRVTGVLVISKLGLDQFDADDVRLVEVLAGHGSVALENARLFEIQRREAESAKELLRLGRELAEADGASEISERVAAGTTRILSCPSASVWQEDPATGEIVLLAAHPGDPAAAGCPVVRAEELAPWLELGETTTVEVSGAPESALTADAGAGCFALAPFTLGGRRGAVTASFHEPTRPDDGDLEALSSIAQQTRLALEGTAGNEVGERTLLAAVASLANALEASDEHTSAHARWLADLALRVGAELGLEPSRLRQLELGALLHDLGKLGIPTSILTKPGPLTEAEREVVQTHPVVGERILEPIEQLREVRAIVRSAHEHYDGSGYPDGLAGDAIPLEARIVLACDAFHAMTNDRPYRKALGVEEARRRLVEASGSQFDPLVVDALLRVLDDA